MSRSGQRSANAVAFENQGFILFSLDVGQAFAKELACDDFSALSGHDFVTSNSTCLGQILDV